MATITHYQHPKKERAYSVSATDIPSQLINVDAVLIVKKENENVESV